MTPEMRQRSETAINLLGGLVATAFLKRAMKSAMDEPANENGSPLGSARALLRKVTNEETPLNQAAHVVYGAGWMAMVGLAGAHFPLRSAKLALAGGAALGALVWAAGQLAGPRPSERSGAGIRGRFAGSRVSKARAAAKMAESFATHVVYGVAAASPIALRAALRHQAPVSV